MFYLFVAQTTGSASHLGGLVFIRMQLFLEIMHQSIPAAPMPPPPANTRALAQATKCPVVGTKEEGKCPAPGIVRPQSTLQRFSFIAQ